MKIIAKILIYNPKGQVLVLQRGETHPHFPKHFDFPGGEVETDEPSAQAVVREVKEETGLDLLAENIALVFEKQQDATTKHLLFKGTILESEPHVALSWEHDDYFWLTPSELQERRLSKGVDSYYEKVLEYLKKENFSSK